MGGEAAAGGSSGDDESSRRGSTASARCDGWRNGTTLVGGSIVLTLCGAVWQQFGRQTHHMLCGSEPASPCACVPPAVEAANAAQEDAYAGAEALRKLGTAWASCARSGTTFQKGSMLPCLSIKVAGWHDTSSTLFCWCNLTSMHVPEVLGGQNALSVDSPTQSNNHHGLL